MSNRLHHTSFTVSDVDAAEAFFVKNFDMRRVGGGLYDFDYIRKIVGYADAVLKIAVLEFPGESHPHRLELIQYLSPAAEPTSTATCRAGAAHLCIEVNDIQAAYERLRAGGVKLTSAPVQVTEGINRGAWAVYFQGPDGIALELFQAPNR